MKKKITAVLLCVALLLTLSVNVFAQDFDAQTQKLQGIESTPVIDVITVTVGENGDTIITEPITPIDDGISLTATGTTPVGYLDTVNYNTIGGWAYQSDIPNTALYVHIYITNNSTGAQTIYTTLANVYRSDLAAAGYGNGYHGFHYDMSWLTFVPGTYTVSAYAIGINSSNAALTYSPKSFTVRSIEGNVDIIAATYIQGWVYKPDAPNEPLEVHAYVYRSNGDLYGIYTATANRYRSDLYNAGIGNGEHGFIIDVDFNSMPEERFTVELHYVDGSGYHPVFYTGFYNLPPRGPITLYGIHFNKEAARNVYYTDDVKTAISNIGVTETRGIYTATTANTALNSMKNSMIWIVHTHGWNRGVKLNHSTDGVTYLEYSNISALSYGALENERCVIYGTCNAGEGREGAENMVNITKQKGAATVIGWETETKVLQMNTWLEAFLISCGQGKTIQAAIGDAIDVVYDEYDSLGGLDAIYTAGSITQKLVS